MRNLFRKPEADKAEDCGPYHPDHPNEVHYHYGYGQRRWSFKPQTGPNDFSDGKPFINKAT